MLFFAFRRICFLSDKNKFFEEWNFYCWLRLSSKCSNRQQAKGFWQMDSRSGKACFSSRKKYRSALIIKRFRTYSSYRRGESRQSPLPWRGGLRYSKTFSPQTLPSSCRGAAAFSAPDTADTRKNPCSRPRGFFSALRNHPAPFPRKKAVQIALQGRKQLLHTVGVKVYQRARFECLLGRQIILHILHAGL